MQVPPAASMFPVSGLAQLHAWSRRAKRFEFKTEGCDVKRNPGIWYRDVEHICCPDTRVQPNNLARNRNSSGA